MSKTKEEAKEKDDSKLELQSEASAIKTLVNMIATICEEPTLQANDNGMQFRAMDTSHVALLDIEIPKTTFNSFSCSKELRFTFKTETLQKILNRFSDKSVLSIVVSNENMTIDTKDGFMQKYSLHLLEPAFSPVPLPKLNFNAKAVMKNSAIARIIKDVDVIADHIRIDVDADAIKFGGKSDIGEGSIELRKASSEDIVSLEATEPSKATYNLDYLKSFLQCLKSEQVTLELSTKMPLRVETALNGGRIHFYLAPRIEER